MDCSIPAFPVNHCLPEFDQTYVPLKGDVSSVQFCLVVQSCQILWDLIDCRMPGFLVHHQLPELAQTHVHWISVAIQPSHPLLSPCLPASIFTSIRIFSNESTLCIRWPKYWSFSFTMSLPKEYSGFIFSRICWFNLAVQGTLKSVLQHHSSIPSILQHSAFLMVQVSHT